MNQTTKKQHYVWRNYLAAWTQENTSAGQIMCLRNNRIFPVSLMKIAHENYFYGVKELSQQERTLIYELVIKNTTGVQRRINEQWLNLYCAPFDFADGITAYERPVFGQKSQINLKQEQAFKNWNIEYIEQLHTQIESTGIPYISLLRQSNLSFWQDEENREKFSFFLTTQYFRTKKTRDAIISSFEKCKEEMNYFPDINPENIWLPLSLIFASNTGVHIAQDYSAVLLQTDDVSFIVGDQPVINTHSTFDGMTTPDKVELFYPITPYIALLLTEDRKYTSGQILNISPDEVAMFNLLEQKSAREMIFAKERTQLDAFISSG